MGLYTNLVFPKDESAVDTWLLDNKDGVIAELKEHYEGCLEHCGSDDEPNTITAKEMYEKAIKNILSCKNDIKGFYEESEYWEGFVEKECEGSKL